MTHISLDLSLHIELVSVSRPLCHANTHAQHHYSNAFPSKSRLAARLPQQNVSPLRKLSFQESELSCKLLYHQKASLCDFLDILGRLKTCLAFSAAPLHLAGKSICLIAAEHQAEQARSAPRLRNGSPSSKLWWTVGFNLRKYWQETTNTCHRFTQFLHIIINDNIIS